MGQKITVGPVTKGLKNDIDAFYIDNDSFPTLINAYQWRGKAKRKRGTDFLTRLQRFFDSTSSTYSSFTDMQFTAGVGFIFNGAGSFNLGVNASLVPGTLSLTDTTSLIVYTDSAKDGTLSPSGTINYGTGVVTIAAVGNHAATANFTYYPNLPVMGLEDLVLNATQFPGTLGFNTKYSYNIPTAFPYTSYDVSFYKNPSTGPNNSTGYVRKTSWTPTTWNGQDYQQFWTTNYQGALWATNGVNVPFRVNNIGMQYSHVTAVAVVDPTTVNITVTGPNLVVGDFVFLNEFDPMVITGINFNSGFIIAGSSPGIITVRLTNDATMAGAGGATIKGIVQYLTNRSDTSKDCLRWYDGDPTGGMPPIPSSSNGWVNFCPPLSEKIYSIAQLPPKQYYLVGAVMIVDFKDRLLFLGPVIQSSDGGDQKYLQDTIIYSQNGTPYYTCSFTGDASLATTVFNPILVPDNQTATANAYWEDIPGYGGFVSAAIEKPLLTSGSNQDVLMIGFSTIQTKLVYSGNDIVPFDFYLVNSELGSGSTFSSIVMDKGVITRGNRGYVISNQTGSVRIDVDVLDEVFQTNLNNNGSERFTAQRDYINEWIYFTYPTNQSGYIYPTQTLFYNYRDNSWGIFNESYTTYGQFRPSSGLTWNDLNDRTWETWNDPWTSGSATVLEPYVIAGNQQGFVIKREDNTTDEDVSLYIQNIVGNMVTCPDHCLTSGDYIVISGALGTISTLVNGKIFSITVIDSNNFLLNPSLTGVNTYLGGGLITRMYVPQIQTKQFPVSWGMARKTRLGPQQYLFSSTTLGQIQLLIFLSQNSASAYNKGAIVPSISQNNSLIYSSVLFTCVESTNLGLTPSNINLQMVTGAAQDQIWHRKNTSLIGDTVQIGFTLSDEQMRDPDFNNQFEEIELHGFILDVNPSMVLA